MLLIPLRISLIPRLLFTTEEQSILGGPTASPFLSLVKFFRGLWFYLCFPYVLEPNIPCFFRHPSSIFMFPIFRFDLPFLLSRLDLPLARSALLALQKCLATPDVARDIFTGSFPPRTNLGEHFLGFFSSFIPSLPSIISHRPISLCKIVQWYIRIVT